MYEMAEHVLNLIVRYGVLILDFIGAALILCRSVFAVIRLFQGHFRFSHRNLTEGISTGLSFLLAGEVLETIVDRDWTSIWITCAVFLMRAAVSILVHWENKTEEIAEEQNI